MRGEKTILDRIEKWHDVEKQLLIGENLRGASIARMCRRELEWVLGEAPQEMEVKR